MGESTTCCIAGSGPAGAVLGLLLARSGIDVIVLEKHGDFLRDFRGDTIHPSTREVIDELGLGPRFEELPQRKVERLNVVTDTGEIAFVDLGLLKSRHPYITFIPQWDFLTMVTEEAAKYPNFRLLMQAEAFDLVREQGRIAGVRYRDEKGEEHEIQAALTVVADGRNSTLPRAAGLVRHDYDAPMDVAWFRLDRVQGDRPDTFLRVGAGHLLVGINRMSYWQFGYLVPKGRFGEVREEGIEEFRRQVADLVPFLGDRLEELDFDAVSVLEVRVDRLRRWYRPGLLVIGDAAHAMSPVAGVGINLAVQDAVAAANRLAGPLRRGVVRTEDLAAVQRRRQPPTIAVQRFQIALQNAFIGPTLQGDRPSRPPRALELARRVRPLRRLMARLLGYGPLPEHVRIPAAPAAGSRE
ncbi:FAD-dependent oxidoreductase [Actinomadura sp. HBU206391]|uniref:FAD-dependent oxidoreductase n=1 Tax=Actinomadura sp. HBU206391 TaxID=2731692 RepID=UPI0016509237|nr:FAD-dependent oxidoreductase [Actinomadura sp. HBU206391]MBC6459253.1 FAD-dependent oxidoreductase [Actinomadura sp. HBU206391]